MPVTVRDIAEASGVSVPAVYQALNETGRLRPETRKRILAATRKLGYRPNASARSMATGRFGCAALLLSTEAGRSTLHVDTLLGIHDELRKSEMNLLVSRLPDTELTGEGLIPRILREWMADGLLVNYTNHIPQEMIDAIHEHAIPTVWLNTKRELNCVRPDDAGAAQAATQRLLALGHRRVAYVDFTWGHEDIAEAHYSIVDRQAGYKQAMRAAGLPPRVVRPEYRISASARLDAAREFLQKDERPTAVVTYSPGISAPLMKACEQIGLRVPGDLSVVDFGDHVVRYAMQPLETMIVPYAAMGREAARMLLERIETPGKALPARTVCFEFKEGRSVAPPP